MEVKDFLKDNFFLFQGLNEMEIQALLSYKGIDKKQFISGEIMQNNKKSGAFYLCIWYYNQAKGNNSFKSADLAQSGRATDL